MHVMNFLKPIILFSISFSFNLCAHNYRPFSFDEAVTEEDDRDGQRNRHSRKDSECVVKHTRLVFRRLDSVSPTDH